jgi:AcrR family transcriptional regulator
VEQKRRTRRRLLEACNRLIEEGRNPTVEEVAEHAGVSRATAYRYFPTAQSLITDAFFERSSPRADQMFADRAGDVLERCTRATRALNALLAENETATRVLVNALNDAWLAKGDGAPAPRLGRRLPLLEEALAPAADRLGPDQRRRLLHALALTCGTEAVLALKDVCGLDNAELLDTAAWAARALVKQALEEAAS